MSCNVCGVTFRQDGNSEFFRHFLTDGRTCVRRNEERREDWFRTDSRFPSVEMTNKRISSRNAWIGFSILERRGHEEAIVILR